MIDIRELARLFVYDPDACENFISKIIDSVDIDKRNGNRKNVAFNALKNLLLSTGFC